MAKKNSKLNFITLGLAFVALISAFLFALLPMVKTVLKLGSSETVTNYGGFSMIFGGTVIEGKVVNVTADFNTLAFIAFLLVVVGAILMVVFEFVPSLKNNKIVALIPAAVVFLGGILMFCVKGSAATALGLEDVKDDVLLAAGPIVGGIFAVLAGGAGVVLPVLKK